MPRALAKSTAIEAEVFRTGAERTVEDAQSLAPDDPLRAAGGVAFVCPVYFQSRRLGVCVVGRRRGGVYFTAAQISLARTTAEFLGIACANAESQAQRLAQLRVQRELEIAAQIQQSLVPRDFPRRADWGVHGLCVNALEAGGDFYDIIEVPDGVLLVIADVMGKGLPAALLAVVLRTAVRAHAPLAQDPGELLNRVSVQVAPDLDRLGMFITTQLVFLEARSARIAFANAGHCAIVVISPEGTSARTLDEGGLPLGVSQHEHYTAQRATLRPGERLLLVTDGILEAPDAQNRELGLEGFMQGARDLHSVTRPSLPWSPGARRPPGSRPRPHRRSHAARRAMPFMTTPPAPTLLVVDDEPHMRRLLQFALAKTGARIVLAANGREALELARATTVDLIVIDFMMPDIDGFATLRELRLDPRYARLPAIMLTSRGQTELREAAEEVGVDLFLTKPFSPIELAREVQRLLATGSGRT